VEQKVLGLVLYAILMVLLLGFTGSGDLGEIILTPEPSDFQVDVWLNKPRGAVYTADEELYVFLKLSESAYVYVYIIDPYGKARLLFPNKYEENNYVSAGSVRRIPDISSGYSLGISGMPGRRIIQVIATSEKPVYFPGISVTSLSRIKKLLEESEEIRWTSSTTYFYVGSKPQMGVVRFLTDPSNVSVYVDGRYVGTTPVVMELDEGRHIAVFYHERAKVSRSFEVRPGATTVVEFAFKPKVPDEASIILETNPKEVMVFVNGEYRGKTPMVLHLKPGNWELTFVKEGYHTLVLSITAERGEQTISVDLTKLE